MKFKTVELAEARIRELSYYNRPAFKKGRVVYEIRDWNKKVYS